MLLNPPLSNDNMIVRSQNCDNAVIIFKTESVIGCPYEHFDVVKCMLLMNIDKMYYTCLSKQTCFVAQKAQLATGKCINTHLLANSRGQQGVSWGQQDC